MIRHGVLFALVVTVTSVIHLTALNEPARSQSVRRVTDDRSADLIDALITGGRFDDAEGVCAARLRGLDPNSDAAAKWTIRRTRIAAARQMSGDRFDDTDITAVKQPVVDFLEAYGNHPRQLFLESQLAAVDHDAAIHTVLRAAISPSDDAMRELAFRRLLDATGKLVSLSERVADARANLDSNREPQDSGIVADMVRLQQQLQVDAVSMALMQTELFPRGSDDRIAAATKSEQAADEAIARLPVGTSARREVERLKVESILRGGDLGRAEAELATLVPAYGSSPPPRIEALRVRVDIAAKKTERAAARLAAYYGDDPSAAPRSVDMDLARLEFLLQTSDGSVGPWLDAIEGRGGAYARRRAEAISLAMLHRTGSGRPPVDPSLIAAQGQDWLRRGNPGRAGEFLSAAAAAETDPTRALKRAGEAAAALVAAGRTVDAAAIMADVALAKPSGAGAAAVHLQAVFLVASIEETDITESLESMLRANLKQWPDSESSFSARQWLRKLLVSQNRLVEAAEVVTGLPADQVTNEHLKPIYEDWRAAFHSAPPELDGEISVRFASSFRPLMTNDAARIAFRQGAALLVDRDTLSSLRGESQSSPTFTDALITFRQRGTLSATLSDPPAELIGDATWRLMRDGRKYAQLRKSIAELISDWDGNRAPSLDHAVRLLWQGQTQMAVTMIRSLIDESADAGEFTARAAALLGSSGDAKARAAAIQLWDDIASGTPQGSPEWHHAKLAAIGLHLDAGDGAEARRRAKYVLLTTPNIDPELKLKYQAASE